MRFSFFAFTIAASLCLAGCFRLKENRLVLPQPSKSNTQPKNIIFIIGDGLALSQTTASMIWEKNQSWFEQFPVVGFHKPYSSDDLITDSAAGATAFSTGVKTKNNYTGVDPKKKPLETILETAEKNDLATGILVTSSVTHATPAAFFGHSDSRAYYHEIAQGLMHTPIDCVVGGGYDVFAKESNGAVYLDSLKARGYLIKLAKTSPTHLPSDTEPFYLFTAENEPATASGGRMYLPKLSQPVAQFLKKRSQKGFFMLIEGSQIDWALHANDRAYLEDELHDFERMLKEVLEFASLDGETLVIVTGDHECGGLSIGTKSKWGDVQPTFAARIHTGALVPVYAFGPGCSAFNGIYENTAIYSKMMDALRLKK